MRIEIKPENQEKLIRDAQNMGMSYTDYINYLICVTEVEIPEQPKILLKKPKKPLIRQRGNYRDNY
jgi:hypothetical protein